MIFSTFLLLLIIGLYFPVVLKATADAGRNVICFIVRYVSMYVNVFI